MGGDSASAKHFVAGDNLSPPVLVHNKKVKLYQGLTNNQIVQSLRGKQLDLLRQWMGRGAQGARQAMGKPLPEGLSPDTLRAYLEIARRQIEAGLDTVGTQAARLKLIQEALRKMGQ